VKVKKKNEIRMGVTETDFHNWSLAFCLMVVSEEERWCLRYQSYSFQYRSFSKLSEMFRMKNIWHKKTRAH